MTQRERMLPRENRVRVNGESIKRMIANTGITLKEVSVLLGKSDNYLSAALADNALGESVVSKLAIFLRVPKDALLPPPEKVEAENKSSAAGADLAEAVENLNTVNTALAAMLMTVAQIRDALGEVNNTLTAMRSCDKQFYAASADWQKKIVTMVKYPNTVQGGANGS